MAYSLKPPAFIRYVDTQKTAGTSLMCSVSIRKDAIHDAGLRAHELRHVWHWWAVTVLCVTLALTADWFLLLCVSPLVYNAVYRIPFIRLWAEVDCYRVQNRCYGVDKSEKLGELLATRYGLKITAAKAARLIHGSKQ